MIEVKCCTVAEHKVGVGAITTSGSAVKTSSQSVWMCSTTGNKLKSKSNDVQVT